MAAKRGLDDINWNLVLSNASKRANVKKLIAGEGLREMIHRIEVDDLLALMSPDQQRDLMKREVFNKIDVEELLTLLSPTQQRELAKRINK